MKNRTRVRHQRSFDITNIKFDTYSLFVGNIVTLSTVKPFYIIMTAAFSRRPIETVIKNTLKISLCFIKDIIPCHNRMIQ